jgi:hypothetical protein
MLFMKSFLLALAFLAPWLSAMAQTDEAFIRKIYDEALLRGRSYEMLRELTMQAGPRLSGSPAAAAAVAWSQHAMQALGFDTVWLQPVMVPHWVRGGQEVGRVVQSKAGPVSFAVCALGGSVGTGPNGITAGVVEVKSFDELRQLGEKAIRGKIVFFNRPMDASRINTFAAYGSAVDQRANGAGEAAKFGAVAVVVRSMGSNLEDYPHTGYMRYQPNVPQIPAVAIATRHAEHLSRLLKTDSQLQFYIETHCQTLPDAPSFNVIGEVRGSSRPTEYILVGGHLDAWDLGEGAHDDGAGCVHSIEALRILKATGYKPLRTLRAVMFMNEENGLRGGLEYARQTQLKNEKHLAAIESDRGGFTPRGFTVPTDAAAKERVRSWKPLLEPYGLTDFSQEGGGADIGPLAGQGVHLLGFLPDSQRYFDYHHTREDTFDKVNKRELELGSAGMAALVYLIDRYGLK